jgi:predicted amidohydrolase YtcJ
MLIFALLACTSSDEPADLVFTGTIHLTSSETTTAVAVRDGVVVAIGADAEALEPGASSVVTLTAAQRAWPGLGDGHTHLMAGSFAMDRLLLMGVDSIDDIVERVAEYAPEHPEEPWIFGYGWLEEGIDAPEGLSLDAVVPDRPAILVNNSGHSALVNSVALDLAGITRDTPDPADGIIGRTEDGEPNGYLVESALSLMSDVALADYTDQDFKDALGPDLSDFVSGGITSVAEIMAIPGVDISRPQVFAELEEAGELPLRVHYYVPVFTPDGLPEAVADAGDWDGDRVRFAGAKLWIDGSMGTAQAWVSEPLATDPDDYGIGFFDADDLAQVIGDAEELLVPLKLHANGDAAVTAALDAFERISSERGGLKLQHTLDHVVLMAEGDLARLAALGLVGSVQPGHVVPSSLGETADLWGQERFDRAYDYRSLIDAGVPLALGTDWPVWIQPSPILNCWSALLLDEHALTLAEGLDAYASGTAQAVGMADKLGTLAVGAYADLVIFDADPLTAETSDLTKISVDGVWVGGDKVW